MKVLFYSKTKNINTGSYRIWINDLCKTLNEIGKESKIVYCMEDLVSNANNFDTIIFCKSAYKDIKFFKSSVNTNIPVGAINVSCDYHDDKIDIQDQIFESIFYVPQFSREYKSKEWWEDYKNEFS